MPIHQSPEGFRYITLDNPATLDTLYQHTQHPYRCPECKSHRIFINPRINPIPECPDCHIPLDEDVPENVDQITLDRDRSYRITLTPAQAIDIIDSIPDDSFHWPAIAWNRVEYYADILSSGKWDHYEQHWHPMRFNSEGNLLTGAQRILAVFLANWPMDLWVVDHSELWYKKGEWVRHT